MSVEVFILILCYSQNPDQSSILMNHLSGGDSQKYKIRKKKKLQIFFTDLQIDSQ